MACERGCVYIPEDDVLLLLGGNKNGQSKDIAKGPENPYGEHRK